MTSSFRFHFFDISQQIRNQQLSFHIDKMKRFLELSREIRNQKPAGYVCCTLLVFSDRLMPIKRSFFWKIAKFHGLHGFMDFAFLDFHHLPGRLNQPRTKLYCNEISKKPFTDYYDRRTTEQTFSNMYIHSDFFIDIDLLFYHVIEVPVLFKKISNILFLVRLS
ncbi:hypothetical protein T06_12919, partial [Trichinella sp. T6]